MRFNDILRLCRQNLWRRKSRTILTVLGVVVGCCSIVLMISLGQGINEQNEKMLTSMGDLSIVTVYTGGSNGSPASTSAGATTKLDDKAVESFRATPGVAAVTPTMSFPYTVTAKAGAGGRYIYDYVEIMGVDMSQFDQMGYQLKDGTMPSRKGEVLAGEWFSYYFMDALRNGQQRTHPDMYGGMCAYNEATSQCETPEAEAPFFNPLSTQLTLVTGADYQGDPFMAQMVEGGGSSGSANGETVDIALQPTGITKSDYNKGYATDGGLIMDIDSMKELIAKVDPASAKKAVTYNQIYVKASDMSLVPEVEQQIKAMGYDTSSYEDMRESLEEQSRIIQLILGGIGAVSLLVAAIGIANTMVMAVTERTREIGIMKALGCYVRDIRVMFLSEAGAIGFFGGLIGCLLSGLISLVINIIGIAFASSGGMSGYGYGGGSSGRGDGSFATVVWQALTGGEEVSRLSVIPWWLFVFAVVFSTLIGLLFGFGPANKAVKIPALDAIKNSE